MVGYVPQIDEHIPTLTVRETLEFAHACTSKATKEQLLKEARPGASAHSGMRTSPIPCLFPV